MPYPLHRMEEKWTHVAASVTLLLLCFFLAWAWKSLSYAVTAVGFFVALAVLVRLGTAALLSVAWRRIELTPWDLLLLSVPALLYALHPWAAVAAALTSVPLSVVFAVYYFVSVRRLS